MSLNCCVCSLPKRGHTAAECEDAFAYDPLRKRFALADGATAGYSSGPWAAMLVEDFAEGADCRVADWLSQLPALQRQWAEQSSGAGRAWYAEEQLAQGAFATFLGVVLVPDNTPPSWTAVAVGDSCLFQVGGGQLRTAFPLSRADEFGTAPRLVGSRTPAAAIEGRLALAGGDFAAGDRFWMMTDALAHWFLAEHEAGRAPWDELQRVVAAPEPSAAFASWIEQLRDRRQIRNDDVTLVMVDPVA